MERVKTRGEDGRQTAEYYKAYYLENKERLAQQFKENYQRIKADPILLEEHRKRCYEATRRYRQRHPERVRLTDQKLKRNRRLRVFALLGGAVCRNCYCNELTFLELNHKNGGGSKDFRQIGNRLYDLLLNGKRDPKDYEVLCRVCNALDHLKRKNPEKARGFFVAFTGKKAVRIDAGA